MYKQKLGKVRDWYEANERRVSTASLVFGFVFDSLTLQRIDALRENLWVVVNLLVVGTVIILLHKQENSPTDTSPPDSEGEEVEKTAVTKRHFWLTNILQFSFGALLGTFFIFYFRSATLAAAWPFLFILLAAMVANELFQKKYIRLTFQISFFYLSIFSFSIFLVPIALKRIGPDVFLLSGAVSLGAVWLFMLLLKKFAQEGFRKNRLALVRSIVSIFVVINILYFTNVIPPIPLALKDAGVYHSVSRAADGSYIVGAEEKGFLEYFKPYETIHLSPGGNAYVYSAIFSPAVFNTRIIHEWQYKDERSGDWVTASRIPLSVSGGRTEGFRTYSMKGNLSPGLWRVNVATERGQLIGRTAFRVVSTSVPPDVSLRIKD